MAHRKLVKSQREEIIRRVIAGENSRILANEFGVTRSYVSLLKVETLHPDRVKSSKLPSRKLLPKELAELEVILQTTTPADHGIKAGPNPEEWRLEHGYVLAEKLFKKIISKRAATDLMAPHLIPPKPYEFKRPTPPKPHHIDQIDPELAKDPSYVAYYLSPICEQIAWREYEWAVKDYDARFARPSEAEPEPLAPVPVFTSPSPTKRTGKHAQTKGSNFTKPKKRK